ncbi:MAG: single-stranded DNA-binding protein [Acutalibacteraceae bacterium]
MILAGRLTKDPELKTTNTGIEVVSFSVAVNRNYKKDDGTQEADFINCQAWRQKAVFLNKYFSKGDGIVLEGKLQTRTYQDKNGNSRIAVEVVVDELEFPQGKNSKSNGTNTNYSAPQAMQTSQQISDLEQNDEELLADDDDLPF